MANQARPRVAIIGGGGAMGRLFARLFAPAVGEVYLLDFFGRGSRPASLAKTLDEVRLSAERRGWTASPILAVSQDGDGRRVGGEVSGERGLAVLFPPLPGGEGGGEGVRRGCLTLSPPLHLDGGEGEERPTVGGADPRVLPSPSQWRGAGGEAAQEKRPHPDSRSALVSLGAVLDEQARANLGATVVYAGGPEDSAALLPRADVVLLALGFENADAYAATLEPYLVHLSPGCLLVDLGSTKTGPMAVLERLVSPAVGLLGAHPLFGPTVSDLTGMIVAAVDPSGGRPASPWREWFLGQLAEARMIVTPTDAAEHDDAMAFVQALTHFALLSLANTFVRLDRDPADLLALRTPVFEPLLYLAARVAHLARSTPETYRAIQTFSTRPDAREAFLESAREILSAIEHADEVPDPLVALFQRYGGPWAPEGRERRERQVREHFLEMGVRLVDGLNQLRQEVVAAVGEVRAVEERRAGQAPRVVVGVVALDLLAPGKRDVASRIRLRRLNLPLGSIQGAPLGDEASGEEGQEIHIPLSRARLLSDDELIGWLFQSGQLVEWQTLRLRMPVWFDHETLLRLLRGMNDGTRDQGSRIWDLRVDGQEETADALGTHLVDLKLAIVLHPAELVAARQAALREEEGEFRSRLDDLEQRLTAIYRAEAALAAADERVAAQRRAREKDGLKKERKAMVDARTARVDRAVRRAARARVQGITATVAAWLSARGCAVE
ncbi:MAG TPA: prephenate dehydrogenase/arogenate dehydrogenase family protein [Chloroflexota bacterium]|nr:prephenate dehydrogenase/arogenate dehydrogenase family protein [Chloroflexota bacterium]